MDIESVIEKEIANNPDVIYLNHAAVAPWPKCTADAVQNFAKENYIQGAKNYLKWVEVENTLRQHMATIINAPSADDIAILKNTSEALSVVAYGIDWQHGDNVVISDQEFPSNRIIWESLASKGVEVRRIDLQALDTPELSLLAAIDKQTRLLSISSVQYATGLKMDLETLGTGCKTNDVLFCVDAIQSIGALEFDVQSINADFVMADTHKWMLGPEGVALFYCRSELRDKLQLNQFGWRMIEDYLNFDATDWQVAKSARRFECGSPNMLGIHAAEMSLGFLLSIGISQVEQCIIQKTQYVIEQIYNNDDLILLSTDSASRRSGIITFMHKRIDSNSLYEQLMSNNIVCAARAGGIRFSPHFYTKKEQIKKAFLFISQLIPQHS